MTGESHTDEPDFLDDDFALEEDVTAKPDLEDLFEDDAPPETQASDAAPDSDDLLFTDHTEGLQATQSFVVEKTFMEDGASTWNGEGLDIEESVGVPEEVEAEQPDLVKAEETFAEELSTLLEGEDEFGLDSEDELELVGGGGEVPADEISMSGPFVLDEGDGAWQEEAEALAAEVAATDDSEVGYPLTAAAAAALDESHEAGWEPLPASNMDSLAEVDELADAGEATADPVYGDAAGFEEEAAVGAAAFGAAPVRRPALVGAADEVEGHDIYADEDEGGLLIAAPERRGRGLRLLLTLAASLALVAGGAFVMLRPEWFGLNGKPERVEQAQVARPKLAVPVPTPAQPGGAATGVGKDPKVSSNPKDPLPPVTPMPVDPKAADPNAKDPQPTGPDVKDPKVAQANDPHVTLPQPKDPVAADPKDPKVDPPPADPLATGPKATDPKATDPQTTDPQTTQPSLPVAQTVPSAQSWPVPETSPTTNLAGNSSRSPLAGQLVRVNDDLLIGDPETLPAPPSGFEGVVPGTRAFAQLYNGNYFIGSVKAVDADRITLRIDTGEVTLQAAAIQRLTQLGSADYEQLQQVTSGFIRLTNNNRLVGGILSGIADDHIVLEFRSNRVMLPKSVIGEIVSGQGEDDVRLDTTREEDDWLRQMSERQLGTGQGPKAPLKQETPPKR